MNGTVGPITGFEVPYVREARRALMQLNVPVWSGQITQRRNYSLALAEGEGAKEYDPNSEAAAEIATLWNAIEKSGEGDRRTRKYFRMSLPSVASGPPQTMQRTGG